MTWRREEEKLDEPVAVDNESRSEADSNVDLGDAGYCMLSAMAAGLETAAVEGGFRLVFLDAAKVVVDVVVARSLRCMEGAVRSELVDVVESSVNRRSSRSLPSLYLYVSKSYNQLRWVEQCKQSTRLQRKCSLY